MVTSEKEKEKVISVSRRIPEGFPTTNSYTLGCSKYNEEELGFFREHIKIHIAAAEQEKKAYESYLIAPEDIIHQSHEDIARDNQNKQRIEELTTYLFKLNAGLLKIELGTYGICRTTGKLIRPGRLFCHPAATEEKEVKEKNSLQNA